MNDELKEGLSTTRRITVDPPRTIDFLGEEARVYATPELLRDIEVTCRELLRGHIAQGKDSVGTRAELDHLAPTLLGMDVDITATLTNVDGSRVSFSIECRDPLEVVARGVHDRVVVGVERTVARLAEKRARAG